jgi:branched-chain amino acid transport system permease protein
VHELVQAVLNGVVIGGVYILITMGLTLVYGVMGVVNFAQGEFLMLGMYGALLAWQWFGLDPMLSAVPIAILVGLLGLVIQRVLIEPIATAGHLAQIFVTVGLGIVLLNGASVVFGSDFHSVQTVYQTSRLSLLGFGVSVPNLLAFGWAVLAYLGLEVFLGRTSVGRAMRAAAQNRTGALIVGIDVGRVSQIAFGLGVGLTALAGAVILPYTTVSPGVGQQYILIMFTVMVLGGLSSMRGTMVAGIVVGVIQSLSTLWISTELQNLAVFGLFAAALILRNERQAARGRVRIV